MRAGARPNQKQSKRAATLVGPLAPLHNERAMVMLSSLCDALGVGTEDGHGTVVPSSMMAVAHVFVPDTCVVG